MRHVRLAAALGLTIAALAAGCGGDDDGDGGSGSTSPASDAPAETTSETKEYANPQVRECVEAVQGAGFGSEESIEEATKACERQYGE